MVRRMEEGLRSLKERLVQMGSIAEQMTTLAKQDMYTVDKKFLVQVREYEQRVNQLEIEVDQQVVELLALQQPVAQDLRFLLMASKIANEVERIGDLAINICESSQYLPDNSTQELPEELFWMVDASMQMLSEALDAFVRNDPSLAERVLNSDENVDKLKRRVLHTLVALMAKDPGCISWAVSALLISRSWERIGDHATNIAEEVIYLVQGREVRHHHEGTERPAGKTEVK